MSSFWENEKERLTNRLNKRVFRERDKVLTPELVGRGYPEIFEAVVKNYARQSIVKENLIGFTQSSRYDLHGTDFETFQKQLQTALIQHRIFTSEEILPLALQAIDLNVDIIVRPRQKLMELLFKRKQQVSNEDAVIVLHGFGSERPFIQRLLDKQENIADEMIVSEEFKTLGRRTEREVYKEKPISAFLRDIDLYLLLETSVTGKMQRLVNSQLVLGMLAERNLMSLYAQILEESKTKEIWSMSDIEISFERKFLMDGIESDSLKSFEPMGGVELNSETNGKKPSGQFQTVFEIKKE